MESEQPRTRPNIMVTGTPGTGKTTLCEMLASSTGLTHINIGNLIKEKSLHAGKDEEFDSLIVDEDAEEKVQPPTLPTLLRIPVLNAYNVAGV